MPKTFTSIVFVEDNPVDRKRFRDEIAWWLANRVDYISTAEDLLDRMAEGAKEPLKPGLVLVDLVLPGMSGYDLVKTIRHAHKRFDRTPLIIVAGDYSESSQATATDAGADWYIGKPITIFSLMDALRNLGRGRFQLGIIDRDEDEVGM